jgi:ketosteroid isomerase-like protein
VEQEIIDALANADGEDLLSHYHEDYMGFETYEDIQGSTSRQDLRPSQITTLINWAWESSEVFIAADLAVTRGYATVEAPPNPKFRVYQTNVFKKEDGEWYLIHTHISAGYRYP